MSNTPEGVIAEEVIAEQEIDLSFIDKLSKDRLDIINQRKASKRNNNETINEIKQKPEEDFNSGRSLGNDFSDLKTFAEMFLEKKQLRLFYKGGIAVIKMLLVANKFQIQDLKYLLKRLESELN